MPMDNCHDEQTLSRLGYFVSCTNFLLYLVSICLLLRAATSDIDDEPASTAAIWLLILCLALSIASIILLIGIYERKMLYIQSWLSIVAVTLLVAIICVPIYYKYNHSILVSFSLLLTISAWFPMYCLYRIYRAEAQQPSLGQSEMHPLNWPEMMAHTPMAEGTPTAGEDPPSYDVVMAASRAYPVYNTTVGPAADLRIEKDYALAEK